MVGKKEADSGCLLGGIVLFSQATLQKVCQLFYYLIPLGVNHIQGCFPSYSFQ